jgi:multiple sugar transport system substrate-binding protein
MSESYEAVWRPLAQSAIKGGHWLFEGFASGGPMRTGDVITSVGSSASVLYNPKSVTYFDNTSEDVEIITLQCPVFENGQKLVVQRGGGICTVRTTPERERAAAIFLKWLTGPEVNTRFTTSAGYLPVMDEAYEKYLEEAIEALDQPDYADLYKTVLAMQSEYTFYTPPNLDDYLDIEERVTRIFRQVLTAARREYMNNPDTSFEDLVNESYRNFRNLIN